MAKLAERDQITEAEEHCFYMTQHVATLPYRAPELLFVMPEHSTAVDIWATGCIFAEMILRRELFPGRSVSGQIKIVVATMGTPPEKFIELIACERTRRLLESFGETQAKEWREILKCKATSEAEDLMAHMARLDPLERITVERALSHPYFRGFKYPMNEKTCPFKVKMDMAAVESLSHEELNEFLASEVPTFV
uniref:Protein kinase domain-containing protein n=1 Tax=Plectus sambesii TaxID=2011161 RepID=A0A914WXF8_9BILA